jgi:GTPase SAR1 family protein
MFYDLTNIETLNSVAERIQVIQETLNYVPSILLVGNELDLEENRKISEVELQEFKETNSISSSIELSLTTGENVEQAFLSLTEMMLRTNKPDYRLDAKRINIKRIMSHKTSKYAFLTLLFFFVASVVGSVILYFVL